jgi:membrane associated rhomboid family serine protease
MFLPLGDDVNHRTFPLAGPILVAANVLVFIYMARLVAAHDFESLRAFIDRWALIPADIPKGHLIGLVSHIFLHGGLMHLVGNMIVLWAFIRSIESVLGTSCCIGFFLVWGAAAGFLHAVMSWGSPVPLIGASGAVAGLIGAYLVAFGPMTKIRTLIWFVLPMKVDIPAAAFIGIWVLMQLQGLAGSDEGAVGIAWYAHLGGFAVGYVSMFCVRDHTLHQLVEGRDGRLQMERAAADAHDEESEDELEEAPDACPHCGTSLGDECRIADTLLRCGNPDCERLVYLEDVQFSRQRAAQS